MTIELEIQIATEAKTLPHPSQFRDWIAATYADLFEDAELTIRLVDIDEMTELNEMYREKQGPTNVLTFPAEVDDRLELNILGDIVICAPIISIEADENHKDLLAHWAHMVIHGALHLLGFDHLEITEAEEMEGLETEILVGLGYPPPYGEHIPHD